MMIGYECSMTLKVLKPYRSKMSTIYMKNHENNVSFLFIYSLFFIFIHLIIYLFIYSFICLF